MRMLALLAGLTLAPLSPVLSPALAQQAQPFTKGTVLVIDHAHLDRFFASPKDRPMAEALAMIPARLREAAHEIPNLPPEAPGLATMALAALASPGRFIISYNGDNPAGGAYGYGAAFSFETEDEAAAQDIHARVSALAAQGGMRLKTKGGRFPTMTDVQTPFALLSFGPRTSGDTVRYEVIFGTMDNPDDAAGSLPTPNSVPVPPGFEPVLRARLDTAGFGPAMQMAEAFAGQNPEAAEGLARLREMGIGGDSAIKVSYVAGHTKEETVSVTLVEGARRAADTLGLSDTPLTEADLAAIPSDAIDVYLRNGEQDWGGKLESLAEGQPRVAEMLEQLQAMTGVDLKADILDSLGGTVGVYLSDSTGGGTIGSAVAMISLKDPAKLSAAVGRLAAAGNAALDHLPIGPGYVRFSPWKDGAIDLVSLRFPGLPVPMELTIAITPRWLIAGPTPQAALAAARQASGKGDGGLASNKAFAQALPKDRRVTSIAFSDTARNMAIGYPFVSMFGSAIANGVRSPADPTREPGLLVPLYGDLRRGVRPRIGYTYWRGDDMISEAHSDLSGLASAAGTVGLVTKIVPLIAIPGAAAAGFRDAQGLGSAGSLSAPLAFIAREAVPPLTPESTALAIATLLQAAQPTP